MRFVQASLLTIFCLLAACSGSNDNTNRGATGSGGAGAGVGGSGGAGGGASTASSSSSGGGAGGMLDNGMPSDMYPAPHAVPPTVKSFGGPKLAAPNFIPIFFSNDDPTMVAKLKDFESKVGATQYWAAVTSEYGVGPATSSPPVDLPDVAPASISDSSIQAWLAAKLNSDDPAFPPADENSLYVIHYPAGTSVTKQGSKSCVNFGGYHNNTTLDAPHGNLRVAYAVIPHCTQFPPLSGIDALTGITAHELIEGVTDPYPSSTPAYAQMDSKHLYWFEFTYGGEVADMCSGFEGAFTKFPELDYTVQRSWSNKSAVAGHDPCVPTLPGSVYFNSPPELNDNITYTIGGQSAILKGAKIALGESKIVDLTLFSDGDTGGPWFVEAWDLDDLFGGTKKLDLSLDRTSGVNGERLHLTITVLKEGPNNTETFLIVSKKGTQKTYWVGVVGSG